MAVHIVLIRSMTGETDLTKIQSWLKNGIIKQIVQFVAKMFVMIEEITLLDFLLYPVKRASY